MIAYTRPIYNGMHKRHAYEWHFYKFNNNLYHSSGISQSLTRMFSFHDDYFTVILADVDLLTFDQ